MAKKVEKLVKDDEVSLASLSESAPDDGVQLITDVEMYEELSEEAKKKQAMAISAMREQAMSLVDKKKIGYALKAINASDYAMDVLNDPEVWGRVKKNVKTSMDLKFLTEAVKLNLQNIDSLFRMGSINTSSDAGERFVALEFSGGGKTTKVVIKE